MRRVTHASLGVAVALAGVFGAATTVAARPEATPATSFVDLRQIVTLGDSYSSGSGIHRDASAYDDHGPEAHSFDPATRLGSSACQRELDETPGPRLAAELGVGSAFIACAGAVIAEIPAQIRAADIRAGGAGSLVTITIGGNDLRTVRGENWPDALLRCITSARCHDSSQNQMANLDEIGDELAATYTAIGTEFPGLTVRVLAYPRLMQGNGRCDGVTGISGDEADWIDAQVDLLNHQIADATVRAGGQTGADIRFVDVADVFDNHGACRFWQRDRYVNDAVFGDTFRRSQLADGTVREHWTEGALNVSTASFHPSSKGYDAYLSALRSSIPPSLLPTHRPGAPTPPGSEARNPAMRWFRSSLFGVGPTGCE